MKQAFGFYTLIASIFLFLVINVQNTSTFKQANIEEPIDSTSELEYTGHAASSEDVYANALNRLSINLHPGTTFNKESKSSDRSLNHCKALVYRTLTTLPDQHSNQLKHLTLYFAEGRRGLGGGSTVILRCSDVTDKELVSVLVHEVGHLVDTGLFKGSFWAGKSEFVDMNTPIYRNDLSIRFYRISWDDASTRKRNSKKADFVSGYAMSDPFEDFAESYNYYVLHGKQFKEMAQSNIQLLRKYLYIKYFVFKGIEFNNDPYTEAQKKTRVYDSTILNYNMNNFLTT